MLKRVPKCINKLKDTQNLEIKTISANYLKREHFKLLLEHATIMTIGKGKGQMARYNQILELFLVIFFSIGLIDEFYINGKLVAFQYSVVINNSYTAFQWYCNAEMRRSMLYFEGFRRDLKRCIADPDIRYYNAMYTSSGDLGANQAKIECGMDQYLVDHKQNTSEKLGNIYGYSLQKCCSCCMCWVKLGGVDMKYWDIKDESEEWNEEKELELKKLEDERKKQARERQRTKQKKVNRKGKGIKFEQRDKSDNPAETNENITKSEVSGCGDVEL